MHSVHTMVMDLGMDVHCASYLELSMCIKAGRKIEKFYFSLGQEILYVAHRDKLKSPKKVSI